MQMLKPTILATYPSNLHFAVNRERIVKETIHGDDGRTQPSIASLIKAKCTVEWLDVGDIHAD